MTKQQMVLTALTPAEGESHTPVQVQKLLFILEKKIPEQLNGPHFDFQPYHYGPFDRAVYAELEELESQNMLEINLHGSWRTYKLTKEGQSAGVNLLNNLSSPTRDFIVKVSEFVRRLSFSELISAIYKAFPETRKHSVFQE